MHIIAHHVFDHGSMRITLLPTARTHQVLHAPALSAAQLRSITNPAAASLPLAIRQAAFTEWADLVAGGLPDATAAPILHVLAAAWALPVEDTVPHYQHLQAPACRMEGSELLVGRVALPRAYASTRPRAMAFAQTGHTLRMLQRIAVAVRCNEGVLLVGESGTGKTTMVQQLANQVGCCDQGACIILLVFTWFRFL